MSIDPNIESAVSNSAVKMRDDQIRKFLHYAYYDIGLNSQRIAETIEAVWGFKISHRAVGLRLASASKSNTAARIKEIDDAD